MWSSTSTVKDSIWSSPAAERINISPVYSPDGTCGGVSCTYTITPRPDASMIATEMDITLASSTIAVGETTSLSLAVLPTSAANYINVSLSSSNEKVATVNNFGKVTGAISTTQFLSISMMRTSRASTTIS